MTDAVKSILESIEILKVSTWIKAVYDIILLRRLRKLREHRLLIRLSPKTAFLFEETPVLSLIDLKNPRCYLLNGNYLSKGAGRKAPTLNIYLCNTEEVPIVLQAASILPIRGAIQYGIGGDPGDISKPSKTSKQIEITEIHHISMIEIAKNAVPEKDIDEDQVLHITYPKPPRAKPFAKPITLSTGDSLGLKLKLVDYALAMPQHFIFKVQVFTDREVIESEEIYFLMQDIINSPIYGA